MSYLLIKWQSLMIDSILNKYSLSGIGGITLSVLADLPLFVKIAASIGTLLIIAFNVLRSFEEARSAHIERLKDEYSLQDVIKEHQQDDSE